MRMQIKCNLFKFKLRIKISITLITKDRKTKKGKNQFVNLILYFGFPFVFLYSTLSPSQLTPKPNYTKAIHSPYQALQSEQYP